MTGSNGLSMRIWIAIGLALFLAWAGPARCAITLVGSTSGDAGSSGASSLTLSLPAGVSQDDLLIAQVAVRGNRTITTPVGWTLINITNNSTNLTQAVYWKLGSSSNPASVTWAFNAADRTAGSIVAYRGVDPIAPINVSSFSSNASSASVTASSVTPTVNGVQLVGLFVLAQGGASFTPPVGMTELDDHNTGAGPNGIAIELAHQAYAGGTAATGSRVAISSNAATSVAHLIALSPAPTANLLAEYRFDECAYTGAAGEVTDTTGSYPATARNGLNTNTGGQIERMGNFDTYARWVETAVPIGPTWTYSYWLKTPITTTHQYHIAGSVSGGGDMIYLDRNSNFRWGVYTTGGTTSGSFQFSTLSAGWHHVLVRGSGSTTQLFIDGAFKDSVGRKASGTLKYLGTSYDAANTSGAQGIGTPMDEVRVYAGLLTGNDLLALYNNQSNGLNADGSSRSAVSCGGGGAPGGFNAFESATAAGAITGVIKTKVAGNTFSLDVVALNLAKTALDTSFSNNVTVQLLGNTSTGISLDANNCPVSSTLIQSGTAAISGGRTTVTFAAVGNVWRDVRVRVLYPTASPTLTACSSDNFAVKPSSLGAIASHADWQTAGTTTTLANTGASGGVVHKAGRPFTLRVTGYNASNVVTSNYDGSPAASTTCVLPASGCVAGTFDVGAFTASAGTASSNTASYSEVGAISATMTDSGYASVDSGDTAASCAGYYACASAINIGRFIPDHFDIATNTPAFTPACGSFTYLGQPFGFGTSPVWTATARNSSGVTTRNYTGSLFKLTAGTVTGQIWSAASGTVAAIGSPPAVSVADIGAGQGTLTFGVGSPPSAGLVFGRTALAAPFNASLTLSASVADSEGIAYASNPYQHSGIGFDDSNAASSTDAQMRFGRLRIANANGSELLALPVPLTAQYWNGQGFVTNLLDDCTSLAAPTLTYFTQNTSNQLASGETSATLNSPFVAGVGGLRLSAPGNGNFGYLDLAISAPDWLKFNWDGVDQASDSNLFDDNPRARAAFGKRKGSDKVIIRREIY